MLAIWILVFREVLEAAMIVSIVAAATRGVAGRWRWIGSGIALGCVGAGLVAAGAETAGRRDERHGPGMVQRRRAARRHRDDRLARGLDGAPWPRSWRPMPGASATTSPRAGAR